MQASIASRLPQRMETWRVLVLAPGVSALAILGGLAAGHAAMVGHGGWAFLALPLVFLLPIGYWRWPHAAPLSLLAAGLLIEEWTFSIGNRNGPFTDRIALFRTPIHGVILLPIEGIIIIALLVWAMRATLKRSGSMPWSPLTRALLFFWCLVLFGLGVGLAHGGKFNFALWEIRPWLLLSCTYFLAAVWLTTRRLLRSILWVIVCCTGFKGIQGTIIFLTYSRRLDPRPDAILGHEESLFFGIFILLTLALWLFGERGRLRIAATALLPTVVIADLANTRRSAWGIVFIGALVLLVSAWVALPERRKLVSGMLGVVVILSVIYVPLYWNQSYGTFAQPARAVRSQIGKPDPRDASSDQYRKAEDANLILNIQQAGVLGKGFGRPIDYAIPIVDISKYDPTIAYIPHDGLLWIWMRLGVQGEIAFWLFLGFAVVMAGRLVRSDDRFLAMFGAVITCALVGYVLQGDKDIGLASLRIAPVIGCLLGGLEAASRMATRTGTPSPAGRQALRGDWPTDADEHAVARLPGRT
jgi:hypothetical protein